MLWLDHAHEEVISSLGLADGFWDVSCPGEPEMGSDVSYKDGDTVREWQEPWQDEPEGGIDFEDRSWRASITLICQQPTFSKLFFIFFFTFALNSGVLVCEPAIAAGLLFLL